MSDDWSDPDTWVSISTIPGNAGAGSSSLWCGCVLPDSCPDCDGTNAEERAIRRDAIAEVRRQWKAGELTPHAYYHRSSSVSWDGMPDREAVRAMDRAGWPGTAGAQPERAA